MCLYMCVCVCRGRYVSQLENDLFKLIDKQKRNVSVFVYVKQRLSIRITIDCRLGDKERYLQQNMTESFMLIL